VLDVSDWYDNNLAFDTNEIVVDSEIVW
jgi:hypothetical protein